MNNYALEGANLTDVHAAYDPTKGNFLSFNVKGSQTPADQYVDDVEACEKILVKPAGKAHPGARFFRPPYGRIRKSQAKLLLPKYKIIMWDVLSGDFDTRLSPESCLKKTIKSTRSGSIVVFHDSRKAEEKLRYVLPEYLEHFSSQGYSFETL